MVRRYGRQYAAQKSQPAATQSLQASISVSACHFGRRKELQLLVMTADEMRTKVPSFQWTQMMTSGLERQEVHQRFSPWICDIFLSNPVPSHQHHIPLLLPLSLPTPSQPSAPHPNQSNPPQLSPTHPNPSQPITPHPIPCHPVPSHPIPFPSLHIASHPHSGLRNRCPSARTTHPSTT